MSSEFDVLFLAKAWIKEEKNPVAYLDMRNL